ncbi:MAG: MFS transporter [Mediterranea sp.]|jgi:MFS family permease|nr:MFS transporter [Mediterranea sp.]
MISMKELGIPVRDWVPDWLGTVTIFAAVLPVMMLNGSYTGSMVEVSGTLGTNAEDITMGFYSAAAGMAVGYPLVPRVLSAVSAKLLIIADLTLQFFLSWICARTSSIDVLIVCSFTIGFLKEYIIVLFIRYSKRIFSKNDVRSEFYAYFYPMVYGGGQLSMVLTAQLAYHYNWKYMYYFMMLLILLAILLVAICFRHNKPLQAIGWKELHVREVTVISTGLLMLMYAVNYGKLLDWMGSARVCVYIVLAPMLIALFIWGEHYSRHPYVNLMPLFQPKCMIAYFYMMLAMFFSSSTTLITNYLTAILKVDATHTYTLYIWMPLSFAVGGLICFWWFRWQRWRFRFLIAGGMGCFTLFFGILYFTVSPRSTYEMLYLPIFLRGVGMMVLFIAFALFATEDLDPRYLIPNAFFMIALRSVLAPVFGTAFFSNALYRLQQSYMYSLSETVTSVDPLAVSRYNQALQSAIAQGHGHAEAAQMATNNLYTTLMQQSTLLALKEILGYMMIITLVIAVVSRFIPFHKTIKVVYAKTGDDMI